MRKLLLEKKIVDNMYVMKKYEKGVRETKKGKKGGNICFPFLITNLSNEFHAKISTFLEK